MKKLYLFGALTLFVTIAFAQTPQGMNYQAVARNAAGVILSNQNIGVRITITNGNAGTTLYQETQTPTTNQFGLFMLNVGNGAVVSGIFATIPWETTTPWLQVEMDATGGTSYILMGSSQLLSVPYALHAEKAATSTIATNMALNDLTDVNSTTPTNGQVLKYNGSLWTPTVDNNTNYTPGTGINIAGNVISNTGDLNANDDITNTTTAAGDLGGTYPNPSVNAFRGVSVSATAPTSGQVLKYNGTQWNPAADNNTTYSQGTGINIAGSIISNTITALGNLSNVNTTGATSGLVLKYNGTNWIPASDNTSSSSGGVNVTPRLSGDGTSGTPLDIAQQGANTGDILQWNGTSWIPGSSAGSYWTANGSNIYNSNIGNVGIGTTTPLSKFDVRGNISLNNNEFRLRDGNDGNHGLKYDATVDGPYLFGFNGGALGTAGQPNALNWDYNGNVNVNSTLTVDGAAANNGSFANVLQFGVSSSEGIGSNRSGGGANAAGLDFYTNNQKRISITNDGFVGIGTTTPFFDLHIQNVNTTAAIKFTNSISGITQLDGADLGQYGNNFSINNWENGSIFFNTNHLQRVTIDPVGNVGIGTNSPATKLHVVGNTFITDSLGIGTATPAAKLDVEGNVKIADGTQGDGKILTSDANGNAYWNGLVGCSAGNSGGQTTSDTINAGSIPTVVYKHEIFDDGGNNYDPITGIFTAPYDGVYNCSAVLLMGWAGASTSASSNIYLRIDKNNIYLASSQSYYSGGSSTYVGFSMSMDVKMVAGDNVRFKITNSSSTKFQMYAGDGDSRMSIHLVK